MAKLGHAGPLEKAARNDDIAETLKGRIETLSLLVVNLTVNPMPYNTTQQVK